eukprot:CAMPEP_0170119096 /NCGR_PEP_ID=MMETSP0020_2-20130122/14169_1 /TAXON_ID=98059 /ORGANISM="Dinobryon sp., Strain UTEXLB2267" /LENGTH=3522 /DNA_ID=CAMNT_0010348355 /DNA_START=356 /DNA_END=10924 /DNA_ORIENTATION=-
MSLTSNLNRSLLSLEGNSTIVDTLNTFGQIMETLSSLLENSFEGNDFKFIKLQMIGSAATTLSLAGCSDLDLVLIVEESVEMGCNMIPTSIADRKSTEIQVLTIVKNTMSEVSECNIKELVTEAKVPVLKLTCMGKDIDISVNQVNGIFNTALLRRYAEMDSRVRQLILAVKWWAKRRGLNNPRNSTLTSYAWAILTIHFLQNVSPPVVPVLTLASTVEEIVTANRDKMFPKFSEKFPSHEDVAEPIDWISSNTLSVGELMVQFFIYFGSFESTVGEKCGQRRLFDVFHHICSIRTIGVHSKLLNISDITLVSSDDYVDESGMADKVDSPIGDKQPELPLLEVASPIWRICIEDPIDRNIDLGKVIYRFEGMQFILEEIRRAQLLFVDYSHREQLDECVFDQLCAINSDLPFIPFQCSHCGSDSHQSAACPEQICFNCKGYGHKAINCTVLPVCYNCRGAHRVSECPAKGDKKQSAQKSWSQVVASTATAGVCKSTKSTDKWDEIQTTWVDDISVAVKTKSPNGDAFVRDVLYWRVHQFANDSLLQDSFSPLPMVFENSKAWYTAFYPFVLEECRAQLHQVAEKEFDGIQMYPVKIHPSSGSLYVIFPRDVDQKKLVCAATCSFSLFVKNAKVDSLSVARLKTLNHCLVSLSFPVYPPPKNGSEKKLTVLETILIQANPDCVIFKGEVSSSSDVEKELFSVGGEELTGWDIALLEVGSISFTRLCNALNFEAAPDLLMPDILCGSLLNGAPTVNLVEKQQVRSARESALGYCKRLNESQQNSVWKVLQVVDSDLFGSNGVVNGSAPSRLQIIKGPPGTGKTSTLVALIQSLIECGLKVHASAPTNVAVCELARRVLLATGIFKKPETTVIGPIDGVRTADSSGIKLRLGNFLLIGDATRLKIQDDPTNALHEILFDDRILRIRDNFIAINMSISNFLAMIRRRRYSANDDDVRVPPPQKVTVESNENDELIGKSLKTSLTNMYSQFSIMIHEAPLHIVSGLRSHANKEHLLTLLSVASGYSEEVIGIWFNSTPVKLSQQQQKQQLLVVQHQQKQYQQNANSNFESKYADLQRTLSNYTEAVELEDVLKQLSSLIVQVKIKPLPDNLKEDVIKQASIVFSTVNVSGREIFNFVNFDVAIVDEATQLVQAETAIVLRKSLRCLVLVGDDKQLPATVISKNCCAMGYEMSCFSRLLQLGYPFSLLNIQYRMHPDISRWPRIEFYDGLIEDGDNVCSEAYSKAWHEALPPYSVFDISIGREETNHVGSKYNEAEAVLVRKLLGQIRNMKGRISVGIISPYSAQIDILKHLETQSTPISELDSGIDENQSSVSVRVCTVDGFQGQECDIIIFTAVRSNNKSVIGFLEDERRLNVAATRARFSFILICNAGTVSSANNTWARLIENAQQRDTLYNSASNKLISDTSRKMKNEEDRFKSFDSNNPELFESAVWKMTFGSDFQKAASKCTIKHVSSLLSKALIQLAFGEWPKYMIQCNSVSMEYRNVIHVYKVLQFSIVWSVDVNQGNGVQYIRIWNFVKDNELSVALSRVETVLKTYSEEYINRCAERLYKKQIVFPKAWEVLQNDSFVWKVAMRKSTNNSKVDSIDGNVVEVSKEKSQVNDAAVLTKFYELTTNVVKLLTSARDDIGNIELPFTMSPEQDKIVRDPKSLFILGRSGTGKTTVILQRMYLQDLLWRKSHDELPLIGDSMHGNSKPLAVSKFNTHGQMLVTASSILCDAIRRSFNNMQKTARKLEEHSQSTRIKRKWDNNQSNQSELLNVSNHHHFLTVSEEDKSMPKSFLECVDGDYPLIITYSNFLFMLDKTLQADSFFSKYKSMSSRRREVNFDCFSVFYFPQFDQSKVVGDAALLFTEIMSFIKGSLNSLQVAKGYLSREEYLLLSERRDSTLSTLERNKIYDNFEKYEKMKAQTYPGDFDLLDVIAHVYQILTRSPHLFSNQYMLKDVYVDEVQDLVPAQIALFKFVCKNLKGFVFAGDTAQTIAHGVGFRFNTVKDIFYHEFVGIDSINCSDHSEFMPSNWQLSENFRTHCGVVDLANSVVELILELFPASIDRLAPETSHIEGPIPIVLQSLANKDGDLLHELFQKGDGTMSCEFGADQVILVRDEKTKREVIEISGHRALVLTVLEAKGMEFTDCLIYNFFASSPFGKDWRTLYGIVEPTIPHPMFNPQQHSQLCVELKLLYVLLTRARQHLIIYDESINFREPMFRYWQNKNLVIQKVLDESICGMFLATASSPEVWQQQGGEFLQRKQYWNARLCFQRAGDDFNERLCNALELEHEADKASVGTLQKAKEMYVRAATMFLALFDGFKVNAAGCYEKAFAFDRAGDLYSSILRHEDAARCYEKSGYWSKAMKEFAAMNDVENTMRCGYNSLEFNILVIYLEMFAAANVASEVELHQAIQMCVKRAAIHFHTVNDSSKMMEFVFKFPTSEEKRRFLQRYHHLDQLLFLEINDKQYFEAGQICWEMRNYDQAQHWYEQAGRGVEAARCILQRVKSTNMDSRFMVLSLSAQDLALLEKGKVMLDIITSENVSETYLRLEFNLIFQFCTGGNIDELLELVQQQVQLERSSGDGIRLLLTAIRYKLQQLEPQFNENFLVKGAETNTSKQSGNSKHFKKQQIKKDNVGSKPEHSSLPTLSEKLETLMDVVTRYRKLLEADILPPFESMIKSNPVPTSTSVFIVGVPSTSLQQKSPPLVVSKAATTTNYFSSASFNKLQQCLEFFDLNFIGKISSATLTPSKQIIGFAITPNHGLISTFGFKVNTSRGVKSTVQEVAQKACKFFRDELMKLKNVLFSLVDNLLQMLHPVDTFGSRALRLIQVPLSQRSIFLHNNKKRLELLVNSFQLNSMSYGDKLKSLLEVAPLMAYIVLPPILTPENIPELQTIRYALAGIRGDLDSSQAVAVTRSILSTYLIDAEFAQPRMNFDVISRALLYAEIINEIYPVARRMKCIMTTEYGKRHMKEELHRCCQMRLIESFLWESSDEFQPSLVGEWKHGSFLWASLSGMQNLIDLSIYKRVCIAESSSSVLNDGIFSPITFLMLVEKYFVVLLLHLKRFRNIVLPLSLASNNFCRRNKAYADGVRRYKLFTGDQNEDTWEIYWNCKDVLYNITQQLLKIIESITIQQFDYWVKMSGDKRLCTTPHRKAEMVSAKGDAAKDLRDYFLSQSSMVVLTYLINRKPQDRIREQYCQRLSSAASKNSLTRYLPHYLNSFLSHLHHGNVVSQLKEFCKSNHDELVSVSCMNQSNSANSCLRPLLIYAENDKVSIIQYPEAASAVQAIVTKGNTETQLNDDDDDAPPPGAETIKFDSSLVTAAAPMQHKPTLEDRLQEFNTTLLQRAAKAKKRFASLSRMDFMLRLVEKELLLAGFRSRWLPTVQILHSVLTPLQLTVETILGQLDQLMMNFNTIVEGGHQAKPQVVAEAHENIDLVLDAQALLQPALEMLLPSNYVMELQKGQNCIDDNLNSKVGQVSAKMQTSKWDLSEDFVREFADKIYWNVQEVLLQFRKSKSPLFSEIISQL